MRPLLAAVRTIQVHVTFLMGASRANWEPSRHGGILGAESASRAYPTEIQFPHSLKSGRITISFSPLPPMICSRECDGEWSTAAFSNREF
jgi:hypothetical protein